MSAKKSVMPFRGLAGSRSAVRARSRILSARWALVVQTFRPWTIHRPSRRSARVWMRDVSVPALGSVTPNASVISPEAILRQVLPLHRLGAVLDDRRGREHVEVDRRGPGGAGPRRADLVEHDGGLGHAEAGAAVGLGNQDARASRCRRRPDELDRVLGLRGPSRASSPTRRCATAPPLPYGSAPATRSVRSPSCALPGRPRTGFRVARPPDLPRSASLAILGAWRRRRPSRTTSARSTTWRAATSP